VGNTPARHVYELRVADLTTGEQHRHNLIWLLGELILNGPYGDGSCFWVPGKVELRIVERQTGHVAASMRASDDAQSLAKLISADLDRLDADAFAAEWGVQPDESATPQSPLGPCGALIGLTTSA
jgi:hypothetical protein